MKRIITTVVSAAAFGLVAAVCVPAQAQTRDVTNDPVPSDVTMTVEEIAAGLAGGQKALNGLPGVEVAVPSGGTAMSSSEAMERLLAVSADDLPHDGPLTGVTRGTHRVAEAVEGTRGLTGTTGDLTDMVTRAARTGRISTEPVERLVKKRAEATDLNGALDRAVSPDIEPAGSVAPPANPLFSGDLTLPAGAVEPVARPAAVDEISPLVRGAAAEGARAITGTAARVADAGMPMVKVAAE
ncbi:hypothetical protein GCM10010517_77620 [Streptosporangium fragile]|uniref:Uncharacterized protein n=1 Tax=Streptosporangium fragile TaxID=46186 RepID=A0ABP6IVL7_9ACTN